MLVAPERARSARVDAVRACEVAPLGGLDRGALQLLGLDPARLDGAAATTHRAAVAFALAGVRTTATKRNPDGVSRGALIRRCSRQHAVKVGASFDVEPICCRQRPCPCCARARARRNASAVDKAVRHRRSVLSSTFLFATLTQVKRPRWEESPREAVHRLHRAWRELTNSKTSTGREFHRLFAGGLRTTETTWSPRDAEREHGGKVTFDGYHAHLHILIEVRAGVHRGDAAAWLQRAWMSFCPGSSPIAQVVRPAKFGDLEEYETDASDVHQLCKYVSKPLEDVADAPHILRELFSGIHGVRLLAAFGEWHGRAGVRPGWRALGEDVEPSDGPPSPRWVGPSIGKLLDYATSHPEGTTDRVAFVGRRPEDEVMVSASEAWTIIEQVVRERGVVAPVTTWKPRRARDRGGSRVVRSG